MATNKIEVKGYVHKIEVINANSDKPFTSIRLGCNEYVGKDAEGKPNYRREWFDVVAFNKTGEFMISAGIKQGDYIEVAGPMRSRRPKEDGPLYWSIIANDFEVLRRGEGEESGDAEDHQEKSVKTSDPIDNLDPELDI